MALIKGIPVTLYERVQIGTDAFRAPIWDENPVEVENVLVQPVGADAVVNNSQLYGKHAVYELCIPKDDAHDWRDCRVDFWNQSWMVFGPVEEWIDSMVPLDWNRKVKVERYE